MKKIKLLTPLLGITALAAVATPLTSCSNKKESANTLTLVTTQKEWVSPGSSITLKFKLGKALESGQTLKGPLFPQGTAWKLHNADFDGDTEWTINGTDVTGVQKFKGYQSSIGDAYITVEKLTFSIWDSKEATIASTAIENFKVSW